MRQVWLTEDECLLDGVRFEVGKSNFSNLKTDANRIWVLKGKTFFDRYNSYFGDISPKNVLEIGVFEGGSALLLADKWPDARIVGIDIREPNPEVAAHVARFGFGGRISLYYKTSQNDSVAVRDIVEREFPDGIDIVIDDASHMYELTKATFDIVFPYVIPGGLYLVEDWAWAHWRDWQAKEDWMGQPALSNLLFEVSMACASSRWIISDVYTNSNFFAVRKASECPPLSHPFHIANTYLLRGKTLAKI